SSCISNLTQVRFVLRDEFTTFQVSGRVDRQVIWRSLQYDRGREIFALPRRQIADREIVIGSSTAPVNRNAIFCDAPELLPHANSPWLLAHLKDRHGIDAIEPM